MQALLLIILILCRTLMKNINIQGLLLIILMYNMVSPFLPVIDNCPCGAVILDVTQYKRRNYQ